MRLSSKKKPGVPRLPEPKIVSAMELLEKDLRPENGYQKPGPDGFNPYGSFLVRGKRGQSYRVYTFGQCSGYCLVVKPKDHMLPGEVVALTMKVLIEANESLFRHVANRLDRST